MDEEQECNETNRVTIEFDEKTNKLTIETPKQCKIELDDDHESITIADKHQNQITMDKNGITLKGQAVNIDGQAVNIEAGQLRLKSTTTLDLDANAQLKISGGAAVNVSSSGILDLKGALIKIN